MKKLILLLAISLVTTSAFSQSPPQGIAYQATIRDSTSQLLVNSAVGIQFTIIKEGSTTPAYREIHTAYTNQNGLLSVVIGSGTATYGGFYGIDWSDGPYELITETDTQGGTNYNILVTSKFMSVPYALHAGNVINYTAGTGIMINNSGVIFNTEPNQTVTINAGNNTQVAGAYPNYTISSTPALYSSGNGISVSGGSITNTAPDQIVNLQGANSTSVTGTYPNYTISSSAATYTAGSGISLSGGIITNNSPDQTVSITGTGRSSVSGTYPNFTVNTPAYTGGTGISVNNSTGVITNTQVVSLTGSGSNTVTGTYPNYTITAPAQPRIIYGTRYGTSTQYTVSASTATTGALTITFAQPFTSAPIITANPIGNPTNGTPYVISIMSATTSSITLGVHAWQNSGSSPIAQIPVTTQNFNFIVVGN